MFSAGEERAQDDPGPAAVGAVSERGWPAAHRHQVGPLRHQTRHAHAGNGAYLALCVNMPVVTSTLTLIFVFFAM